MKIRPGHRSGQNLEHEAGWQREQEESNRERRYQARQAAAAARARRTAARRARRAALQAPGRPAVGVLRVPRTAALVTIAAVIAAASLVSFAESYRGLYDWAREHGLTGLWAAAWPLQLDTFIAVGELALFVALADRWSARSRAGAWAVTLLGLAASVAGNVGHVHSHLLTDRATAAVPPLAAAAALAVGLGVLKRVVQAHHQSAPGGAPGLLPEAAPRPAHESAPEVRPEGAFAPAPGAPALNGQAHPGRSRSTPAQRTPDRIRSAPASDTDAELHYASELAEGRIPSQRRIRADLHVGQDRARQIREHLDALNRT